MIQVPQGFSFATAAAGFRYTARPDVGCILSHRPAATAGVFTTNRFQAAPVLVAREHIQGRARAILVNAGQANACTGEQGLSLCRRSCELVARAFELKPQEILPASTGVIGEQMDPVLWQQAADVLARSSEHTPLDVAKAMLTTDTYPKLVWREVDLARGPVRVLAMAKGSGMICPQMATMLGFVLCDAEIDDTSWQAMLERAVHRSFNRISVDGDTSTNDCVLSLANAASQVQVQGEEASRLEGELTDLCQELAYLIVQDAEGGTKVVRVRVHGARDDDQAERVARTVAHSPLVKTAMFGRDPNWGRIVAAIGRSNVEFEPEEIRVSIAGRLLFQRTTPIQADLDSLLAPYLHRQEIPIDISLGTGKGEYEILTSDLSVDYVRINAEYRS